LNETIPHQHAQKIQLLKLLATIRQTEHSIPSEMAALPGGYKAASRRSRLTVFSYTNHLDEKEYFIPA
jgi:hypothetical protein